MEEFQHPTLLDSINSVITPEFTKLSGLEFNYDKDSMVNYTIFKDFLCMDCSSIDYTEFVLLARRKLQNKKNNFLDIKAQLESNGKEDLGAAYGYYVENFKKIELFFELLELYIPVEARKVHIFFGKSGKNTQEGITEIEELEEKIFGKKLSDRFEYASKTLNYIKKKHQEKEGALSGDEQKFLNEVINDFEVGIGGNEKGEQIEDEGEGDALLLNDPLLGIKGLDMSILDKEIPQAEYLKIFKLAIDILGLEGVEVKLKDNISNVSVSVDSINIPASYKTLTVLRIIELISHELERHAIGNANNKNLVGNLKSLSYLGQEEGVAHVMEKLAIGYDLDHIPINRYMPRMLAGELLDGERFKKFLHIMNKLDDQKVDVEAFFKRFKRGKDNQLPGVNPKEKLYGIGAFEIITRLRKGENPLGFFLAKNGTQEQEQINEMITGEENGKIIPQLLDEKKVVLPLMLGELLRYQLINSETTDKGMLGGFLKYFQTRYGKLFDRLGFSYRDFIKNHIGIRNKENKAKVSEILVLLQS